MLGLCLARGVASITIAASQFHLGWIHSIEKIRWEEDWRVTPAGLVIDQAVVRGSGAGMEPPEGAQWRAGAWRYRPTLPPQATLTLAASRFTSDHTLCAAGVCQPLRAWIEGDGPVQLQPCVVQRGAPGSRAPGRQRSRRALPARP